jgi:Ca-activated chloride channel family protein
MAVAVAEKSIGKVQPGVARPPAAILLLSDGSQTVGRDDPAEAAKKARKLGIRVSTVSLGTPAGVLIRKIQGGDERIQVPPAPDTLRELARTTNGTFYEARSAVQLKQVYKDLGHQLVKDRKKHEITVVLAGIAVVLLIAGAVLSGIWFRRIV